MTKNDKIEAEIIKELKDELNLWKDLKKYVMKNMKGKTHTKELEKEVNYMIKERIVYFKNLKEVLNSG